MTKSPIAPILTFHWRWVLLPWNMSGRLLLLYDIRSTISMMPLAKAVPRNLFWHIHPLVKHEDEYARIQIPLKRIIFFSLPSAFCIFYQSPPLLLIYSKLCGYYHASKWRTSFSFIKRLALIPAWAEPLILFNSHCSLAAISSLSPTWYAQLMTPYHSLYLPNSWKDIPMLDCLGLEYSCRHRSFNLSIFILGSIKTIFTHWNFVDFGLLFLATWLASITPKDLCTAWRSKFLRGVFHCLWLILAHPRVWMLLWWV